MIRTESGASVVSDQLTGRDAALQLRAGSIADLKSRA